MFDDRDDGRRPEAVRPPALTVGQYGSPETPLFDTAWRYDATSGMVRLPDLAGGETATGALAMSASGRVIAGFGTDATGRHAVLWVAGVPRTLEQTIADAGGRVPDGWPLSEVIAMTPDARAFTGNATNPHGQPEAYRVVLPCAP